MASSTIAASTATIATTATPSTEKSVGLTGQATTSSPAATPTYIKYAALAVLVLQNALLALIMRQSHLEAGSKKYLASTAVLTAEVFKLGLSTFLSVSEPGETMKSTWARATKGNMKDFASLCVPALLYLIQNNLAFFATEHLDPAPYQLLYQLKIFTTALLSVMLLSKKLTREHWLALLALFVGVVMVQLSTLETSSKKHAVRPNQNPLLGLVAIVVAVFLSGLSGVWLERILKDRSATSVWIRNMQLALISMVLGVGSVVLKDGAEVSENGFFSGYTPVVWITIILQGGGGILVALVVKYADNILKGFATSLSTVLSTIVSVMFMGFTVSPLFLAGATTVLAAAYRYGLADSRPAAVPSTHAAGSNNNTNNDSKV